MILGIFGLLLIGISVFGRVGAGSDSTKESAPAPKNNVNQFRDDLFVIIDDAQNGFGHITDSDGHRLVPPLAGALRGQLNKQLTGINADVEVEFACYDYDLDGKQSDTFDGLVDKVKHAIGDSWSENSFIEHQNNPAPQQRVWFTSPGQRSEVDVFEGYAYVPSTKQWSHQLQVWVKDLNAKPTVGK